MKNNLYKEISQEFASSFVEKVKSANSIVITSHLGPDDDSIASVLAVYYYLINYLNIPRNKIRMLYSGEKPTRWQYFTNFEEIEFIEDLADNSEGSDLIILLDGLSWNRFSKKEKIKNFPGTTFCIDHHPNPITDHFNYCTVTANFSSTSEIIYKLFFEKEKLDTPICEILLMGILGDTGNFRFITPSNISALTVAKKIIEAGRINVENLQSKYQKISQNGFLVLSELMTNSQIKQVPGWPDFLVSKVDRNFLNKNEINPVSLDEGKSLFADYMKKVEGASWGFAATPYGNISSVSFRSLPGSVDVKSLVVDMNIGGGLVRAAGGKLPIADVNKTIEFVIDWMRKNKPVID